jgi:hypothetical protein
MLRRMLGNFGSLDEQLIPIVAEPGKSRIIGIFL